MCEGERKRQLTLSTNLHFLLAAIYTLLRFWKPAFSCYSPQRASTSFSRIHLHSSQLSWNLQPTPNSFTYLFILKMKERKRERGWEHECASWVQRIGLESANISHAHLTTPRAGLGRGESRSFSFDYLFWFVWAVSECSGAMWPQEMTSWVGFECLSTLAELWCRSSACVSARSCWWGAAGEEPPWEVTAGVDESDASGGGRCLSSTLRSGQLALFPPAPKGLRIEA